MRRATTKIHSLGNQAEDKNGKAHQKKKNTSQKITKFWLTPLLAGSCFSIGYELTQRSVILFEHGSLQGITSLKKHNGHATKVKLHHKINTYPTADTTNSKTKLTKKIQPKILIGTLEGENMQQALERLPNNFEKVKNSTKNNNLQNEQYSTNQPKITFKTQGRVQNKTFNELFKTLPTP